MLSPGQLTVNILLDALVWQDAATVHVNLVTDSHIITQNSDVLQPCPSANCAIPTNDGALNPSVLLNLAISEQYAALQTNAVADYHIWANCDVWTNFAVLANLGGRVNQDVTAVDI